MAKRQGRRTAALFGFVNDISSLQELDAIIRQILQHLGNTFHGKVSFHALNESGILIESCHPGSTLPAAGSEDMQAAQEAVRAKKRTGASTTICSSARATYYPLISGSSIEGVVGLGSAGPGLLPIEDESLLLMYMHQAAIALEKQRLRAKAQKAQVLSESDRLYKTLFNSLSHELRTPLATICGASSSLLDGVAAIDFDARATLTNDIFNAAERLNRLVANLLDMSRIESGSLKLKPAWCDIADILNAVAGSLPRDKASYPLQTTIDDQFPLLKIDNGLITQAFFNIVLNAVEHTPEGSRVLIKAFVQDSVPVIFVEDSGPGFPPEAIPFLFDKFYRIPGSPHPGTGLGLSIAKGFVEAHKGTVEAVNRTEGGARIVVRFPQTPQSSG